MAAVTLDAEVTALNPNESACPFGAITRPVVPSSLWAAGPSDFSVGEKIGFFCSSQCPGGVILKTFDAIATMRDAGPHADWRIPLSDGMGVPGHFTPRSATSDLGSGS